MHPADILAAVRKSRYRFLTNVAAAHKLSAVTLRTALRRPQRRAELAISRATGIPLHILWPDRWTTAGRRIVARGRPIARAA
jgi:Ner family transcriptional regulator